MGKLKEVFKTGSILLFLCTFLLLGCEDNRVLVTEVNYCSSLNMSNIDWPDELSPLEIDTYSLAINITGSYEGVSNWNNISNNFDGQGISLGVFQQNLGQGSLQPLLNKVNRQHRNIFNQHFDQLQQASLSFMLNAWSDRRRSLLPESYDGNYRTLASFDNEVFTSLNTIPSTTDILPFGELTGFNLALAKASNSVNQYSVDWAVQNLFESNGKTFKPHWRRSFRNLAGDPRYISMQIEAGFFMHKRAMSYMKRFDARELRSYLFFYDIVVQNGSINAEVERDYLNEIDGQDLTENERMIILLQHRVLRSKKRWRADVMSRKMTILQGQGRVHKKDRNFSEEFCLPNYELMMVR